MTAHPLMNPLADWVQMNDEYILADNALHWSFTIRRHGEGRKYWEVHYPDGTWTHSALSLKAAKTQAASWEPDPSLAELPEPPSLAAAVVSGVIDSAPPLTFPRNGYSYQSAGEKQRRALSVIAALVELRAETELAIRHQVELARINTGGNWNSNAAVWEEVGKALGVTKQSAQAKYGK